MEVEEAVPEPETGFYQGAPGLGAADAVDPQSPLVLEGLDGRGGARAEGPRAVGGRPKAQVSEAMLEIDDRRPGVAGAQGEGGSRD
jgi:hypothetical protein